MSDNGDGPKVLGEIRVALVERAPGQAELQFTVTGVCQENEVQARGLWDKAHETLAQLFMQRALQAAMTAVKPAPAAALDALRKHTRG